MKYNVGDEFISETVYYKNNFESYIIVDRDLNDSTYTISYKNPTGNPKMYPNRAFHESIIEQDIDNKNVKYKSKFTIDIPNRAYFNNSGEIAPRKGYVAIDENHRPHPVPPLIPQTPEEVRRFEEARRRQQRRKQERAE